MKRLPAHAGSFYPGSRETLIEAIERAFLHKLGPQKLPPKADSYTGRLIGAMVPHAGYIYSGHVAAHAYLELANSGKPEVVFILGPNHTGLGAPIALDENEEWETPLGSVPVDIELSKELASRERIIRFDSAAHMYEHSIEVQIPFLQYIFDGDFKIVPISIMLQTPEAAERVGKAISTIIKEKRLKSYIVASSDMSHYVEAKVAREKDKLAIDKILNMDYEGLYTVVIEEDISMCGVGPVMTLINSAKILGYKSAKLLKYANSGDVTGDYSQVVAYASIVFERSDRPG